jgi:NADH-quinone oxidoreductase subunit N
MIRAILPEIGLVVLALIVLLYDLVWQGEKKRNLGWLTSGGIAIIFLITVVFSQPGEESELIWGGMLRHDWLSFSFTLLFLFGAAVTCLFAMEMKSLGQRGEFYLLLLTSTIGMILMASSADLVIHRSRIQILFVRSDDFGSYVIWFQPDLRFYWNNRSL